MPRFVVHEHHASRLHWDFRLEMGGVLVSWAVPKGPSMDPAHKRLAVRVDDHELSYITFEGTIEEGSYGAGEVLIWDKGEYRLLGGGPEEGKLEFELRGDKLKGAFALLLMKGKQKEWILIKKRDDHMERGYKLLHAMK